MDNTQETPKDRAAAFFRICPFIFITPFVVAYIIRPSIA